MTYRQICVLVDHYSDLVETARTLDELVFRLDLWYHYKQQLLAYQN